MKIAVSNIAWPQEEEPEVAQRLSELGVEHVELAPTKIFDDPLSVTDAQVASYLGFWSDHGISVVAFQSMLFGRLDLTVFDSPEVRSKTTSYLVDFIGLAGRMGASAMVFGSPKNRIVPEGMSEIEALDIATDFFDVLGTAARDAGTVFCVEPNPTAYECNFVVNAASGLELVRTVGNPGFGLHLDAAGMSLAGDDVSASIRASSTELRHFHVSAPYLGELETEIVDHPAAARALDDIGFDGYISIEMRPGQPGEAVDRVDRAVRFARAQYGHATA